MTGRDPQVLDPAVLDELCASVGGDRAFVVDLVETYLADGAVQVDAIAAALASGDTPAAVRPAHTLKSSSATVGAMRLATLAKRVEEATRAGQPPAVDDLRLLPDELAAVTAALRAWIGNGGAG